MPLVESGNGKSLRHHASHLNDARCDADTIPFDVLIVGYSEVSQRPVAARRTVVIEYDVPRESRGSRIRIEGCHHLRSVRVSVDAVLERDRRQFDVRERQVKAAVAQDDHCEVSRRRDQGLCHRIDAQDPCATNRVRRRIQYLALTGDELSVRQLSEVDLRLRAR
jgi:hypothetical protein